MDSKPEFSRLKHAKRINEAKQLISQAFDILYEEAGLLKYFMMIPSAHEEHCDLADSHLDGIHNILEKLQEFDHELNSRSMNSLTMLNPKLLRASNKLKGYDN